MSVKQKTLFEIDIQTKQHGRSGTFVDNMKLPVHRWFRYSAGFSAAWAAQSIAARKSEERLNVFDPFVGSGTVAIEAIAAGANGIGVESHPFVRRLAKAKLNWPDSPRCFESHAEQILAAARKAKVCASKYPPLVEKCFPTETLNRLDAIRRSWTNLDNGSTESELCWLALVAILRSTSPVGTAPWQYVLPKKTKAQPGEPFRAYRDQIDMMVADMSAFAMHSSNGHGEVLDDDARVLHSAPEDWADLIITSPPYANNYDYADATRLEQSFLGEINGWGDLQTTIRPYLVRSCTQHVAPVVQETEEILAHESLEAIRSEIREVCAKLRKERETRGGRKPYHTMVAFYFYDLSTVWLNLRRVARTGSSVCFVIGDSAPYGIHVPVERWLGELALAAGFRRYRFEKIRDRNTKWKNRKHRVKLHEGQLWVDG